MVNAKPAAEIVVDGKPTGLYTPQRALPVSPGKHVVTFVNRELRLKKSYRIDVDAGETKKMIVDLR